MDNFSFTYYEEIWRKALDNEYCIITLKEFFCGEYNKNQKILINRIDVDFKIERLNRIYNIFNDLGIKASIYVRLHSPSYNLLTFGNIAIIKKLISIGCEIGLHTELEDAAGYCSIKRKDLLKQEIKLFEAVFDVKIYGTASHGDMTHFNNLDFWKTHSPEEFNLLYEAYDEKLWNHCRYVSDSEWTKWKAYDNGRLIENDRRTPIDHIENDNPKILLLLTHPESWYEEYIHE